MRSSLSVLVLLFGCAHAPPSPRLAATGQTLEGCLQVDARSDTLAAALGGALGDSLPATFRLRLTDRPVPQARGADSLGLYQVLFRDEYGVHMGGWVQRSDSLLVRFRGYGLSWDLVLAGLPDSLRGWAEVRTHRAFFEHATVGARRTPC